MKCCYLYTQYDILYLSFVGAKRLLWISLM